MKITLRDIDPVAIKKIDELAKEKKISRNQFFKIQINRMAMLPELNIEKDRLALTTDKLIEAMELQQKQLEKINDTLKGLTNLIVVATDMPDHQVDLILNNKLL